MARSTGIAISSSKAFPSYIFFSCGVIQALVYAFPLPNREKPRGGGAYILDTARMAEQVMLGAYDPTQMINHYNRPALQRFEIKQNFCQACYCVTLIDSKLVSHLPYYYLVTKQRIANSLLCKVP